MGVDHSSGFFVGLPDKFSASDCLPIPSKIQAIPRNTKVLGAFSTPDLNTLMPLFCSVV